MMEERVQLSTPAYWVSFSVFPETSPLLMGLKRITEGTAPVEEASRTASAILRKSLDQLVAEKQIVPQMFHHAWEGRENNRDLRMSDDPLHEFEGRGSLIQRLDDALCDLTFSIVLGHNFDADLGRWQNLVRSVAAYVTDTHPNTYTRLKLCARWIDNTRRIGEHLNDPETGRVAAANWRLHRTVKPEPADKFRTLWTDEEKAQMHGDNAVSVPELNDRIRDEIVGRLHKMLTAKPRTPEQE